jgi:hypothetical protein
MGQLGSTCRAPPLSPSKLSARPGPPPPDPGISAAAAGPCTSTHHRGFQNDRFSSSVTEGLTPCSHLFDFVSGGKEDESS